MPVTQYLTATTLDGFIATPQNSLDWLFKIEQGDGAKERWDAFLGGVGAMVMGSTTYTWCLEHDDFLDNPGKWHDTYADRPCWVFTHRDLPAIPDTDIRFVQGDVAAVHPDVAAAAGDRNVWLVGGGDLVGSFHDAGLLDEIRAQVAPVLLGAGAPLLPRHIESLRLREVYQNGQFAELTYDVVRS